MISGRPSLVDSHFPNGNLRASGSSRWPAMDDGPPRNRSAEPVWTRGWPSQTRRRRPEKSVQTDQLGLRGAFFAARRASWLCPLQIRGKGRGRRCALRRLFEAPPGSCRQRGAGGWAERASRPRGAAQVRGRSFGRAGGRRVDHTASCPWPGPTTACAISCGSMSRMSLQVARSTKPTESSTCCIVAPPVGPALMSRSPAQDTHAPSAGLAVGDDGFVARRSSVTAGCSLRPRRAVSARRLWWASTRR